MNLPERLRALPDFDPPAGGWQRLSARMNVRRRRWMAVAGGLALAASVLVAIGTASLLPPFTGGGREGGGNGRGGPEVAQLISRSQRLESQLRQARPQVAVWDSGRAHRADLIEHELSLIDAQLGYAQSEDPAAAERLWSERVQLMHALLELHQTEAPALQYASYQY